MDGLSPQAMLTTLMLAALLGALVGLVLALTGAGGGVMAVPLLVMGLHLSVTQAVPLALLAVGAAAALGALAGLREGVLRYRAAGLLSLLAMITAPLGVMLAHRLPAAQLMLASAAVLVWTSWRMGGWGQAGEDSLAPPPRPCALDPVSGRLRWTAPCAWRLAATGSLSGLLTGLLGVGGGFVIVPALSRFTALDARSVAATSLAVIALAASAGLLGSAAAMTLDLGLALPFGAAACAALLLGRRWCRAWQPATLRRGFALLCLLMAGMMLMAGLRALAAPAA